MQIIHTKNTDSRRKTKHYVPGMSEKALYYVFYRKKGNILTNTLMKAHQPPNKQEYVMMTIVDKIDSPGIGKSTKGNMNIQLKLYDYNGKCLNCSNPTLVWIYTNVGSDIEEVDDEIRKLLAIPSLQMHRNGTLPLRERKRKRNLPKKRCTCKK